MSSTITGTPSLTRQTRTTSRPSTTQLVCTWEGHCLGDTCSDLDDCDRDWVCGPKKTCQTCCLPATEPTFISTQSIPSDSDTTTTSSVTASPTSSATISSPTTSTTTQASSSGINKGAAAGIGVGGAVFVILCIVGGWWAFRRRKAKNETYELGSVPPSDQYDDRKELYRATGQAQELPNNPPPVELSATQLVELHDSDIGRPKGGKVAT